MNLVNELIYYYLLVNLFLVLLLSLPLPSRIQRLFLIVLNSDMAKRVYTFNRFLVLCITMLVAENIRQFFYNEDKKEEIDEDERYNHLRDTEVHAMIFMAERNIYLNVAALTVGAAFNSLSGKITVICELKKDKLEKKEQLHQLHQLHQERDE